MCINHISVIPFNNVLDLTSNTKYKYFVAAGADLKSGITVSSVYHWRTFSVAFSPQNLLKTVGMLYIISTGSNFTVLWKYYNRGTSDGGTGTLSYLPICELTVCSL